ncbi:hypothetical protein [Sulfitobacter sp. MOLA879]|uniref:hypothetical protein n=1 Tax=Sulfitobacter sp. MOLA879 TaxID=3368579 RepID=UPI0037471F4E
MISVEDEIGERRFEFHETFGGAEFIEDSLIAATERMWEVAAVIYGDAPAEEAFGCLVGACFPSAVRKYGWRDGLREEAGGVYSDTPGGSLLHDLTAYADYGLLLESWNDLQEAENLLGRQVEAGLSLLELASIGLKQPQEEPIWRVVSKANARWKLDMKKPLNKTDLSLLSGLAEQSIRNRLAGKSREMEGTIERVEAEEASEWLKRQKHFVSSIWRYQSGREYQQFDLGHVCNPVFVPVAADGSLFHRGLVKDGVFVVGYAGEEEQFDDFEIALRKLQQMVQPTWRRPTENNRWTQVKGVRWIRLNHEEIYTQNV